MQTLSLEKLHELLLDTAKEFHRVCQDAGICYYMLGGTMLGALRHGGFIPWDDDMDFGVMRKDFPRLVNELREKLPSHYDVVDYTTSQYLNSEIVKIVDTRTVMEETWHSGVAEPLGINIDLFPLDEAPERGAISNRAFDVGAKLINYCYLDSSGRPLPKRIVAAVVKGLLSPFSKQRLVRTVASLAREKGDFIANHWGAWGLKEIVPREVMGIPTLYQFEDTMFYGPAQADAYLTRLYGDYMQLPPERDRHIHILNAYIK